MPLSGLCCGLPPPQQCFPAYEGARMCHRGQYEAYSCTSTVYFSPSGCCRRGRVAETPEELRKSGERGSGRRRREERRVSEGRYGDFERSDDGGVKGLS
jgi:hypothetical protein